MTNETGRFIVLEGADGCGKSTQATRLCAALEDAGRSVLHVRDPGGSRVAEAIRGLLLDPANDTLSLRAETFLYLAARAQLADEVVLPALAAGVTVVSERWTLSTEVYQGLASGFPVDEIRRLGRVASGGRDPDLVILLDVDGTSGLKRLTGTRDRIEGRPDAFHLTVAEGYRRSAEGRPDHQIVPPGSVDEVAAAVLAAVEQVSR